MLELHNLNVPVDQFEVRPSPEISNDHVSFFTTRFEIAIHANFACTYIHVCTHVYFYTMYMYSVYMYISTDSGGGVCIYIHTASVFFSKYHGGVTRPPKMLHRPPYTTTTTL